MNNCIFENFNPLTNNPTMTSMKTSVDYPISESVRMDGNNLLIDTDTLINYLQTDRLRLRYLREDKDWDRIDKKFPEPIRIKGCNFWRLSEIRQWELDNKQFWQRLENIDTIFDKVREIMDANLASLHEQVRKTHLNSGNRQDVI